MSEVVGPASGNNGFLHSVVHWLPFASIYVDALNRKHKPCANHPMRWRCKRIALVISCHNSNPHACFFLCCVHCIHILVGCGNHACEHQAISLHMSHHTFPYLKIPDHFGLPCLTLHHLALQPHCIFMGWCWFILVKTGNTMNLTWQKWGNTFETWSGNVYCFTIFLWFPMVFPCFSYDVLLISSSTNL